ncbi:hypothetical protein [Microcoleus sp. CAWBG640]
MRVCQACPDGRKDLTSGQKRAIALSNNSEGRSPLFCIQLTKNCHFSQ